MDIASYEIISHKDMVMAFDFHMVGVFETLQCIGRCPISLKLPVDPSQTVEILIVFLIHFSN